MTTRMTVPDGTGEASAPTSDIDLTAVFLYGPLRRISRERVRHALTKAGGRLTRSSAMASVVVLAAAKAPEVLTPAGRLTLPFSCDPGKLVSEAAFLRALALTPPPPAQAIGVYGHEDVARTAGLTPELCRTLVLFDVLRPTQGHFQFEDLAAARQVAGLITAGLPVPEIVAAAALIQGGGHRLSQVRLVRAPWGGMAQAVGGRLAHLDGQMALLLDEEAIGAEEAFSRASTLEVEGDLEQAERWYEKAERIDRRDPTVPFNRGNVLVGLGRTKAAKIAFRQAILRAPAFAEASFNLAVLHEADDEADEALRCYGEAIGAHPAYSQALFNRARLLTARERYSDALADWDAFIRTVPEDPDIGDARRLALLCRMHLGAGAR